MMRFPPTGMPLIDRIEFLSIPEPNSGCLLWLGNLDSRGYPRLNVDGRRFYVSRLVWELHRGSIPPKLQACHKCDNPVCIEVNHLFLGTIKDNADDRDRKGRTAKGSSNGQSKLTDDQVLAIKSSTKSQSKLATEFGLNQSQISRIRSGKRRR